MDHVNSSDTLSKDDVRYCPCICFIWAEEECEVVHQVDDCTRSIRWPLFQRGHVWTTARIVKGFGPIFWEMCNQNPIIALNGEVMVWFIFRRMSSIHWARIAKRHFVSSTKGFGDLETKFFFICLTFPPLAFLPWCIFFFQISAFR